MDTNNTTTNWIIAGAVVLVLVLGGWWLMQRGSSEGEAVDLPGIGEGAGTDAGDDGAERPGTSTGGTVPTTTGADGEAISVADQAAGVSVTIASMNLSRESWVAVRDERSVLGAARFSAGATSGTVELLRGTEAGKTYSVIIYIDNGNRAFDLTGDELVEGVSDTFVATAAAEE